MWQKDKGSPSTEKLSIQTKGHLKRPVHSMEEVWESGLGTACVTVCTREKLTLSSQLPSPCVWTSQRPSLELKTKGFLESHYSLGNVGRPEQVGADVSKAGGGRNRIGELCPDAKVNKW